MISLFIIIAGIRAMMGLPRDAFPQVDFDVVTITTAYPGAPAEDVEKFVTIPIEKELKGFQKVEVKKGENTAVKISIAINIILIIYSNHNMTNIPYIKKITCSNQNLCLPSIPIHINAATRKNNIAIIRRPFLTTRFL